MFSRALLVAVFLPALLLGCGIAQQQEFQKRYAEAAAGAIAGADACRKRYDQTDRTQAIARADCLINATMPLRQYEARPDLFDLRAAKVRVIAERYQNGQISFSEASLQMAEFNTSMASYGQQQDLASRAVRAQESAAAAANRSVMCNQVGTTTICN